MIKIKIALVVSVLYSSISFGQLKYIKDKADITKQTEAVMAALNNLNFNIAFKELKNNWPLPENELDQLEAVTIKQFNNVSARFGKTRGYEFISHQKIKAFLIRKIYVLKFEKHMIRVLFTYYNSGNGWIINSFKWDDTIDSLLKEVD